MLCAMDAVVRDIVETFASGLGPFSEPEVIELVRELPLTLTREDIHVLVQGHQREGMRTNPVLVAVLGEELVIAASGGQRRAWPVAVSSATASPGRLAGMTLTIVVPEETLVVSRAMTIDESERLVAALSDDGFGGSGAGAAGFSTYPPIARLGASATLYVDRIAFRDGVTRMLDERVSARPLELSPPNAGLQSVNRFLRGVRRKPRHVLVDGPGWSQALAAPAEAPEQADEFADAVNYWARNS
jgi:hypothetical protein